MLETMYACASEADTNK
jgi:hypothetical protein